MKGKGNSMDKLGAVFQQQMLRTFEGNKGTTLELGTINGQLALVVPSLENPIPHGEYMLCRQLTIGAQGSVIGVTKAGQGTHPHGPSGGHSQNEYTGVHSHPASEGAHVHDVLTSAKMRWIMPGDRVLVAWVGTEAVVVDLVLNSKPYGG